MDSPKIDTRQTDGKTMVQRPEIVRGGAIIFTIAPPSYVT